jgi:hypothetical protein
VNAGECISLWLRKNCRAYWDDCIAKELEPSRRQKVNRVTKALSAKRQFLSRGGDFLAMRGREESHRGNQILSLKTRVMKGASPQSREGEWSRVGKRVTRRRFLNETGLTLAATSAAPLISAPFVSRALADTKTPTIVQWSHFVPAYETWFDRFAKNW